MYIHVHNNDDDCGGDDDDDDYYDDNDDDDDSLSPWEWERDAKQTREDIWEGMDGGKGVDYIILFQLKYFKINYKTLKVLIKFV